MRTDTAIQRGVGVAIISAVLYLTIVVLSTPNLKAVDAILVSLNLDWWVVGGISVAAGTQVFLITYAKVKGCPVRHGAAASGTSGFFSGLSSFLSFLSLIPVGCCGTWIYVLSFLPGLVGVGASGFLITHGLELEATGLILMTASVAYTYFSVRKRLAALRRG